MLWAYLDIYYDPEEAAVSTSYWNS